MQIKVHIKSRFQCHLRFSPLGYQRRFREFFIQKCPHILPQADRLFFIFIVFHQRTGHIHTETVTAKCQPETHDVFQFFSGSHRSRRIGRLLPAGIGNISKSIVQRRLRGKTVDAAAGRTWGDATQDTDDSFDIFHSFIQTVGPYIAVGIFIFLRFHRFLKPRMCHSGMSRHQIQKYVHPSLVCRFK